MNPDWREKISNGRALGKSPQLETIRRRNLLLPEETLEPPHPQQIRKIEPISPKKSINRGKFSG
jgi:hypothetical protein